MSARLVRTLVPALVPLPLIIGIALAQTGNSNKPNPNLLQFPNVTVVNAPQPPSTPPAGLQAGKVHVDKDGKVKAPTPDEDRDLSDQLKTIFEGSPTNSTPITLPNGVLGLTLGSDTLTLSVVGVNSDGTLAMECVKPGDAIRRPPADTKATQVDARKADITKEARHAK